jgi:hypothetical protein
MVTVAGAGVLRMWCVLVARLLRRWCVRAGDARRPGGRHSELGASSPESIQAEGMW